MDDVTSPKGEPLTLNKRMKTLMFAKVLVSTPGLDPTSGASVEGEELGCLYGTIGNLTTSSQKKEKEVLPPFSAPKGKLTCCRPEALAGCKY